MKLFSPINLGKVEIKNRITFPAIATGYGSEEGFVTDRMIDYYEERSRGGAGLVITEFTAVERRGRSVLLQLMIDDDKYIPGLKTC